VHRYEVGNTQPTLEGMRELARALRVSADALAFRDRRAETRGEFRQIETLTHLDAEEKRATRPLSVPSGYAGLVGQTVAPPRSGSPASTSVS
jgi:hypothetical protein